MFYQANRILMNYLNYFYDTLKKIVLYNAISNSILIIYFRIIPNLNHWKIQNFTLIIKILLSIKYFCMNN